MLLTGLAIGLGVTVTSSLSLAITSFKYSKKLTAAEKDAARYRQSYNDAVSKLEMYQKDNESLNYRLMQEGSVNLTYDEILKFIADNAQAFAHDWAGGRTTGFNNTKTGRYLGSMIDRECKTCHLVSRQWQTDVGEEYCKSAGFFLGEKRVTDDFQKVVCIGKLPLNFLKKNKFDVLADLSEKFSAETKEEVVETQEAAR